MTEQAPSSTGGGKPEMPPETVRKIAERVYALLMADLRRQRERSRMKPVRRWK